MKNSSKRVWGVLLFFTGLVTLYVAVSFISKGLLYYRCSHLVEGKAFGWRVVPKGEDRYHVAVDYTYEIQGKSYTASYLMQTRHLAKESAQYELEELKRDFEVLVWYEKGGGTSMLERAFPYKEMIRFVLAFGVLLYFYYLKVYVQKFNGRVSEGT